MRAGLACICILLFAYTETDAQTPVVNLPADLPAGTFSTVNAFTGLSFGDPVALVTPPGESNRLFVVEQLGQITVIPDLTSPTKETFLDIRSIVRSSGNEEGLLGLAFHPNYNNTGETGFGQFYVFFQTTISGQRYWRVSRFLVDDENLNRGDASTEQPLITQLDQAGNHNGGDIHFGDDGYLYISVGDEGGANDTYNNGQHIDKDFFSAILRIDVDQSAGNLTPNSHSAVHANTYRVPADNPFVGATSFNGQSVTPANVRSEIWAIGLRNPWRMSFDRPTGRLFVADVGQVAREEINIMSPAVFANNNGVPNYGWSYREGFNAFISGPLGANPPAEFSGIDPIHDYPRSDGRSVSGGLVYRGASYPELTGDYLFADYVSGRIWAVDDPGGSNQSVTQIAQDTQIAGFGIDPSTGDVLLADDNSNRQVDDQIKRLVRSAGSGDTPPELLSEVGAFSNLASLTPASDVIPYQINHPFWSDGADKSRWFALPQGGAKMTWAQDENWAFPEGQVWIKHFDLDLNKDNPGTNVRRLETRFLVKTADDVYGITYRWNDAQTDAELVDEAGLEEVFTITENGETHNQTWQYPSRSDCRTCHTPVAGFALGFNTRQLNLGTQMATFESAGYFSNDPPDAATLPRFAAIDDELASLEDRSRAYLATNCAQCHQSGGTALGNWDASAHLPLASTGIVDGQLVNNGGDSLNRVLVPGLPERSMLLQRIDAVGNHAATLSAMPPLGSSVKNQQAVDLITDWVESQKRILFVRGGDRTGGFLEAGNDTQRTEHLCDINNYSTSNGNHGWGELADTLRAEGYLLEQITEGSETVSGQANGIPIDFETLDLARYSVIVKGSNNAVYDTADIDALDNWIRAGGVALFISDANWGSSWADAPNSDQQFLDRFGLIMNQDRGTYSLARSAGEFLDPDHPIFAGVADFHGEGVSPISIGTTPPDVAATILANAKNQVRRNVPPFGGNSQGNSSSATANDAALLIATVGAGRIAGHFDRNTFFNQNGAGSDITRFGNRQYAINLFAWLTGRQLSTTPDNLSSTIDSPDGITISWDPVSGNFDRYEIHRGLTSDFASSSLLATTTETQYTDTTAPIGVDLYYWVRAVSDTEFGDWSEASPGYRRTINFSEYLAQFASGLTGADALPDADPNGDGLSNLVSAAADIDPDALELGASPIVSFSVDEANQQMVFTYRRFTGGLHGVTYQTQRSTDGTNWLAVDFTDVANNETILPDDPDGDGSAELIQVTVGFQAGAERELMRLTISAQ